MSDSRHHRRFENQTVLISGASRGLGRGIAVAFAAEGAHVVVGYRSQLAEAEETLHQVEQAGGRPILVNVGASKPPNRWSAERFGELAV